MNVILCEEKVKDVCVITLFSLSKCIKTYIFSISYHQSCVDKAEILYSLMNLKVINKKFKTLIDEVTQNAYTIMNLNTTVIMLTDKDENQIVTSNSIDAP